MGEEIITYLKVILALAFVIGLIVVSAGLIKKTGLDKRLMGSRGTNPRLSVLETIYLDPKRRIVIVKCDDKEHVLLLGISGDLLIESRISGEKS